MAAVAYSYVRFSTPEQLKGDSLRRQTEAAEAWCKKNGVQLDTSLTFRDLGVSGLRGKHRLDDTKALAQFLKAVQRGRVSPGSFLIIENLDRLSREEISTALRLWLQILEAGINIVQLHPEIVFRHDRLEMTEIVLAIVEMSRGHSESAMKSVRATETWRNKRKRAATKGEVMTGRLPAWIEKKDGKLQLLPDRAAVVKRIFRMAADGYGVTVIIHRLIADGVPPWGRARAWVRSYVATMLKDERALGRLQPCHKRKKEEQPACLLGYYPAVVTEDEWHAARAGLESRKRTGGPVGTYINIFSGLLFDARDGDKLYVGRFRTTNDPGGGRLLMSKAAAEGRARMLSFPLWTFEQAVLFELAEIDPSEILDRAAGPDEVLVLSGQIVEKESKIAALEAALDDGEVAAIARKLRQLEQELADLLERLKVAQQKKANPLSEAWGEARGLIAAMGAAEDREEFRIRLRSVLRRMMHSIWLYVVPRGRNRFAAAQVWFSTDHPPQQPTAAYMPTYFDPSTGEYNYPEAPLLEPAVSRTLFIEHRPPKANAAGRQQGGWRVSSFAEGESSADPGTHIKLDTAKYDPIAYFALLDGINRDLGQEGPEWHPLP
jgi:DNA invertase Pin-like site-specific DNA recombinase